MSVGYASNASQFVYLRKLDNTNSIVSQLYVDIILHAAADCSDNGIGVEGVKAEGYGGVDHGDGDGDSGGDVGGGVDDGDGMALPCAALPRIDEVSWFGASVSGAVP